MEVSGQHYSRPLYPQEKYIFPPLTLRRHPSYCLEYIYVFRVILITDAILLTDWYLQYRRNVLCHVVAKFLNGI
jgi:hypothetical protein